MAPTDWRIGGVRRNNRTASVAVLDFYLTASKGNQRIQAGTEVIIAVFTWRMGWKV